MTEPDHYEEENGEPSSENSEQVARSLLVATEETAESSPTGDVEADLIEALDTDRTESKDNYSVKEEDEVNQLVSNEKQRNIEAFEIDQDDEEEPNILQQISEDVDDLDEEAQGLLADKPSQKGTGKVMCCCFGPFDQIGNCTIFSRRTFERSGWGIMGPHWFGPPCVSGVLLAASSYFIEHAYKRIGPITTGICTLWTLAILYLLVNASYRDPGIVRPEKETPTKQHRWCELCKGYQPPKGAHCPDCNVCVAGFDHHCVWMGCCIGKSNLRQFTLFNIAWLLYLAYCVIWVATLGPLIFRKHH